MKFEDYGPYLKFGGLISFFAFLIYIVIFVAIPEHIALRKWKEECAASGGYSVPTSVYHTKTGKQFGDYVCAKLELVK